MALLHFIVRLQCQSNRSESQSPNLTASPILGTLRKRGNLLEPYGETPGIDVDTLFTFKFSFNPKNVHSRQR